MNSIKMILVIIASAALASCASFKAGGAAPVVPAASPSSGYMLGPDDIIRIIAEQHPEWSGEFTIRPDGKIFIQSIGEIKLEGLLKDGAGVAIASVLEKYVKDPKVTIDIVRYASQVIYVMGEVSRPGRYSTEGKNITLRDAVILAGLPGRFAADRRVYIISPRPQRPSTKVVNLYRILYRGELENNAKLQPGDIVYVPKNFLGMISDLISTLLSPISNTVPAARAAVMPIP